MTNKICPFMSRPVNNAFDNFSELPGNLIYSEFFDVICLEEKCMAWGNSGCKLIPLQNSNWWK